ncbi:VPA1269 family protein, partial [Vibrio anguillarum]
SNPIKNRETVYNALPYTYIKRLRKILCPVERGHFSNWNWAIEQSDSFISNGRHLRDWFIVDRAAIDKHDPDCVWRKVKVDKTRSIRIDGILRSFREGEHFYVIWSPVRAMALYLKLQLPLRTFQVRMLDSG